MHDQWQVSSNTSTSFTVLIVEFSSANYSVSENEDTVSVCLTTSIGSSQPVSVIISTATKTATGQHSK